MSDTTTLRAAPRREMVVFGTEHGQVRHADDPAFSDARPPTVHGAHHGTNGSDPISPESIGAADRAHSHVAAELQGVARSEHQHGPEDLRGVAAERHKHSALDLDGVAAERHSHRHEELAGVAAEKHRHVYEELAGVAPARHTHAAEDINTGVLATERILSSVRPGQLLRVAENGQLETVDPLELLLSPVILDQLKAALQNG